MDLSLVIPCYNSADTIRAVLEEFTAAMQARPQLRYEIVLVNDHSADGTWQALKTLADERAEVVCIDFARNFGQPNALMAGFAAARGAVVFTSDDDGQCPVGRVFDFWDKLDEGYDVVCARYEARHQGAAVRRWGTGINDWLARKLLHKPGGVTVASFFMARRFVIESMLEYKNAYPYIAGLLLRTTRNIGNVTVEQRARLAGRSGYSFGKLVKLWMNGFTAFSVVPLRMASFLGIAFSAVGFISVVVVLVNKLANPAVAAGWSSTISLLLLLGGLVLLVLGMIGEYVGRIYICINQSPQYVIREVYPPRPAGTEKNACNGHGEGAE